jgi:hypothetical protein
MSPQVFTVLFLAWFVGVLTNHLFGGLWHLWLVVMTAPMLQRITRAEPPFA